MPSIPSYLDPKHHDLWAQDPRAAHRAWFAEAGLGLFVHYGLYSQLGRHEWVQHVERIPVADYERLADSFDPSGFDAEAITDLALAAGMRYVNLTACHHEGFCLWDSQTEPFNSVRHGGRDLVRELGRACARKGLGFFVYFTHVLNWRHPDALPRERLAMARPEYPEGDPRYRSDADTERYWAWAHGCLDELARLDVPITGIWLDLIMAYYLAPDLVPVTETYRRIRAARPEALIAFKQGATGDEDFAAPEFHFASMGDRLRNNGHMQAAELAERAWTINRAKHNEICMTLQTKGWGYTASSRHKSVDEVWTSLRHARMHRCNLLVNTGPLPDGSLHGDDVACLRALGERIRREGLPHGDATASVPTETSAGGA